MTGRADFARSPFENVLHIIPQGHEKALKQAFYNILAMVVVAISGAACYSVFVILGPFVKSLLWALLCGSVLHPFKQRLVNRVRCWIQGMRSSGTPLPVAVVAVPFRVADDMSESLGCLLLVYLKPLLALTIGGPLAYFLYHNTPVILIHGCQRSIRCAIKIVAVLTGSLNRSLVITLALGFIIIMTVFWKPSRSQPLRWMSYFVWTAVIGHLIVSSGPFRVPLFVLFVIVQTMAFIIEVYDVRNNRGQQESFVHAALLVLSGSHKKEPVVKKEEGIPDDQPGSTSGPDEQHSHHSKTLSTSKTPIQKMHMNLDTTSTNKQNGQDSSFYVYGVFWACVVVHVWNHLWIINLLPFPIIYFMIKHIGLYCGLWKYLETKVNNAMEIAHKWLEERFDDFVPPPIQCLGKMCIKLDGKIIGICETYVDAVGTLIVMFLVIVFAALVSTFMAVQIYGEGVHLIHVSSNLINNTLVSNPELYQLLPEGWENVMDSMVNNAYLYGREWLGKMVRSILDEHDKEKAELLEMQVVELWDRVYQMGISSYDGASVGPKVSSSAVFLSWDSLLDALKKMPELMNMSALMEFAKENVGTLMSVTDSLWGIVKGNVSLAFTALTTLASLLFGGGTALLNFVISLFVFLTALFYLLSSSGPLYKPVELVTKLNPNGSRLGIAAEEAISSVFRASFKMATFYGLWTWLVHTMFQVNIVFIPSALAALFAAVPFLGTYWACIPATLELWLVQERGSEAIIFFICHLLPMSVVDTLIYSEIKRGGHPYLTGLAVAGGLFYMGVEGAIIGPLLLCCVYVAINMYTQLMQESPDGRPARLLRRMDTIM